MVSRSLLTLFLVTWLPAACAMPGFMRFPSDTPTSPPETFTVLTYNVLHGLQVGRFTVRLGESAEARAARFTRRITDLAQAQPDIILLQEVNPLPEMAIDYVRALQARGLNYSEVHQVDACGLRLAPGVAFVPGLNNGLVILAKAPHQIRKLDGVKLSGGIGACRDAWGVQFNEFRYWLIAEVTNLRSRMRYLVATAHFHSGIERDGRFLHELMEAHRHGRVQHYNELMDILATGQERRLTELHTLVAALRTFQAEGNYAGVIIGGDFNFEAGSPEYQALEGLGFQDTYHLAALERRLETYDPQKNPLAMYEETALPPALSLSIAGESPSDQQEIVATYRHLIGMARRIDFLFSLSFMSKACLRQHLFGEAAMPGDLPGSDHYGVLNTYSYQMLPC